MPGKHKSRLERLTCRISPDSRARLDHALSARKLEVGISYGKLVDEAIQQTHPPAPGKKQKAQKTSPQQKTPLPPPIKLRVG